MRFLHATVLSLALGCGGSDEKPQDTSSGTTETDSPTDTDPGSTTGTLACEADVFITHGEGGCFGSDYAWEFKADLTGCAETALLNIWRTDGTAWDEQHTLGILSEGPDRIWQAWYGSLTHQAPQDAWVPGSSTAFDCQLDAGKVTFAIRMVDSTGATRDCAVWGHAPALVVAGGASALNSDAPGSFADCDIEAF